MGPVLVQYLHLGQEMEPSIRPVAPEAVAVAGHHQDLDVVGETVKPQVRGCQVQSLNRVPVRLGAFTFEQERQQ